MALTVSSIAVSVLFVSSAAGKHYSNKAAGIPVNQKSQTQFTGCTQADSISTTPLQYALFLQN